MKAFKEAGRAQEHAMQRGPFKFRRVSTTAQEIRTLAGNIELSRGDIPDAVPRHLSFARKILCRVLFNKT